MDYLCIGSNGLAQVGEPDFHMKNKVEMAILMDYLKTNFPVPEEFSGMCYYGVKWFRHDFGNYSEIVLIYDDQQVEQWEMYDDEKFNRFWEWFYRIESLDLEADSLSGMIESRYSKILHASNLIPVTNESKAKGASVSG